MLDKYIYGDVDRISPEAPVPVVKMKNEIYELGGAANVAMNINSLGGQVFLMGYIGEDNSGRILKKRLEEKEINYYLPEVLEQTIQKTRVVGNNQQIVRIDREYNEEILNETEKGILFELLRINPDVIIASDYAKGCLTNSLFSELKNLGKKIIVDPKPENMGNYLGVNLITPNLKEAREMSGIEGVEKIGRELQKRFSSNILLTKGKNGMSLFEEDKLIDIPTQAKEIYDVSGAGDTVVSVMGLGVACGLSLEESAFLANHAAGIAVSKTGTYHVSSIELKGVIELEYEKIKTLNELKLIREDCLRKNKKVVWTNGCFDFLHPGHTSYLKKARQLGDCLFVGLNNDESVRKLKGEKRPINNEKYRAEVLSSLECVDYVVIFPDLTVENCLKELKPDVFVKGGDYDVDKLNKNERRMVEDNKGEIKFIPIEENISTTEIIDKIKSEI
jgi:D-beta-D-heptose 7-phosphate kinase/D-beta-D-heptose 1-phosphate adenosyltransferase